VIPRSILISVAVVALIYVGINLSILGVVPWREFVPAAAHPESDFIVSTFMERVYGSRVATLFTALVLWTAFGSVFALLLGYSRIPYAAASTGRSSRRSRASTRRSTSRTCRSWSSAWWRFSRARCRSGW